MDPLPPCPPTAVGRGGAIQVGLYAGRLVAPPAGLLPRRWRRLRRWRYAAAAGAHLAVGAAIIDLGYVGAAFVWILGPSGLTTWEHRRLLGRGCSVGTSPVEGARYRSGGASIALDDHGGIRATAPVDGGLVAIDLAAVPDRPATLVTPTAGGGWNVTEKAAGYGTAGTVSIDGGRFELDGAGWRDWTVGRQDRRSSWRWAAAAGTVGSRRVGLNVSTGMNRHGPGEDVVWWDGEPHALEVEAFAAEGGDWHLGGPGWSLTFVPVAERGARERIGPVFSDYVQPVGTFSGTLPGPNGDPVEVAGIPGVTERHDARW